MSPWSRGLSCLVLLAGAPAAARALPPDEHCVSATHGGHQYWFCRDARSWADAGARCNAAGSHLVRVDDSSENIFVRAHVGKDGWLGASARPDAGWAWIDGEAFWQGDTRGNAVGGRYGNWAAFEPREGTPDTCAVIDAALGSWKTTSCASEAAYVCEEDTALSEPPGPEAGCVRGERNGHQYWFCGALRTFDESQNACQSVGLELASIDDAQENEYVRQRVPGPAFMGLNDRQREGAWRWMADGRLAFCEGDPATCSASSSFASWGPYQPASSHCQHRTRNGRAYWFCDNWTDWSSARRACESVPGTSLARVNDAAENSFISHNVQPSAWLGATDAAVEGQWRWQDDNAQFWTGGRFGHPVGGLYANWSQNNPSDTNQANCLYVQNDSGGFWWAGWCTTANAWVCEGPATSDPQVPDAHDCATIDRNGLWSSVGCTARAKYVCESAPADGEKSLDQLAKFIRDDYRTGRPRVSDVELRAGTNLSDPFSRFGERLGLRSCVDGLRPNGVPRPVPSTGLEAVDYRQVYRGVPVHTRGYVVQRDPSTHVVHSFTGRLETGLSLDTTPVVSEAAAFSKALVAIGGQSSDYPSPRPRGELVVFPATQGTRPVFKLAWLFSLPAVRSRQGYDVAIAAKDGSVLTRLGSIRFQQCTSADASRGFQPAGLTIQTDPQSFWNDPIDARGGFISGLPQPYLLSTVPAPLGEKPLVVARCEGEQAPKVAAIPTSSIFVDSRSPLSYQAGSIFVAAQQCLKSLAATYQSAPGMPWRGIDGTGDMTIDLRLWSQNNGTFFRPDPGNFTFNFNLNSANGFYGASLDVVCHEIGHGVLWTLLGARRGANDLETRTLEEGFADVLGAYAEMSVRGFPGPQDGGWCIAGDEHRNGQCLRNMKDPFASLDPRCRSFDLSGTPVTVRCPKDFGGPDYCPFGDRCRDNQTAGCCDEHGNSLVLSHWFYVLSNGDAAVNAASCPYNVEPLNPSLDVSARIAARLLFSAVQDERFMSSSGFPGLADATLTVARTLGDDVAQKVAKAWFAVGVKEDFSESLAGLVVPARNAKEVPPWITFNWPVHDGETEWDFQLNLGPFDLGPPRFQTRVPITETQERNGKRVGVFRLALPPSSKQRYFWRVRPHTDDPWSDCYPIHSFEGTGPLDTIDTIEVVRTLADGGRVRPGTAELRWDAVQGAVGYDVWLNASDVSCQATAGGPPERVAAAESGPEFMMLTRLRPNQTYWVNIRPVGPADLRGDEATGDCFKKTFDTTGLRAPEPRGPADDAVLDYHGDPALQFVWNGYDGPESFDLRVYERDAAGQCVSPPLVKHVPTGVDCGVLEVCPGFINEALFPRRNPTGYCWEVVSVASGTASPPSALRKLSYHHLHVPQVRPGVDMFATSQKNPGLLPGPPGAPLKSYDLPEVTLEWQRDPDAIGYVVKLGRWPWTTPLSPPDPLNCLGPLEADLNACSHAPREVTFRSEVIGGDRTSVTVPGDKAARGRYCWTVWPIVEDAHTPPRQPLVEPFPQFCYTTGPAEPHIDCQPMPPATGFSSAPITCVVNFPYVADGQSHVAVEGPDADHLQIQEECQPHPGNLYFNDLFDCNFKFKILPVENQAYKIRARAWSSDKFPTPVLDAASLVWDKPFEFATKSCGGDGDPCCQGAEKCDSAELACHAGSNECLPCGGPGQMCCTSPGQPACTGANAACTRVQQDDLCCAASLDPPVLVFPERIRDLWLQMTNSQSACWQSFIGGTNVPQACRDEIQTALQNGTVQRWPQFQVGWTPAPGAVQYEGLVASFSIAGVTTTSYTTTGLTIGFPQPVTEAPGLKWVVVNSVDACSRKGNTSPPGIFIYEPNP
jgi:Zn-dependent metalloprotease